MNRRADRPVTWPWPIPLVHANKQQLEIWGEAQRESAWRPKSDWGKIRGEGKISLVPKSRGPNSNALAYAERASST